MTSPILPQAISDYKATIRAISTVQPILLSPEQRKAALVDIGLYALSHGHWQMALALTMILQRKGLRHE